ncbi:MAG: STAS domain-containing protein [Gammaproteobacteria bacterium]|nr:STAS domain-containing protein [Gammaproteobacteria bacterium]
MPMCELTKVSDCKIQLTGALNFDTVPALWNKLVDFFSSMPSILIDLTDIDYCDSAGVALLLECVRFSKTAQKPIQFINLPAQLLALAKATAVDGMLPIYDDNDTNKNSA